MKYFLLSLISISTLLISTQASATIISGNVSSGVGGFVKLSLPFTESNPDNTVGADTFQSPNLYGFDEGQNIAIPTDINVDILANGLGGGNNSGVLLSGSTVASHYIFFDPKNLSVQAGSISFDSNIFGIITSSTNLAASDFLINTGVTYLNSSLRGLESGDAVVITGLQTISVNWAAGTPGDYIRVLTDFSPGASVVPVPAAVWFFGTGLLSLLSISRFKNNQS